MKIGYLSADNMETMGLSEAVERVGNSHDRRCVEFEKTHLVKKSMPKVDGWKIFEDSGN